MTLEEINAKKVELRSAIDNATTDEEVEKLKEEVEAINNEVPEQPAEENKEEIKVEEERELIRDTEKVETRNLKEREDLKMEERKTFGLDSVEYRNAWAKRLMGLSEDKFTEDEKRALGDAVGTTATTFVASTADTQGINNVGLLIPTSVRKEFMEVMSEESPIFRDIRKLQVNGYIDLPWLDSADDAEWYAELTDTKNEGQEFKSLQLTGHELAKDVVLTWKAEEMAVEGFIDFILEELREKMGSALINAVIYGDGNGKPTGITNGLTPVTDGDDPIANIVATYKTLNQNARKGAKAYISTDVNIEIVGYKDLNGNYPFLQGLGATKLVSIEVDPYLKNNDIIVGNGRNYILNENTQLRVDRERTIKGRKTTYGGYMIADGHAKPNSFAYGQYNSGVSL